MRGSLLSTVMPIRVQLGRARSSVPAWSENAGAALGCRPCRSDVLVGRRVLRDRRRVDAGLGGEGALTDIGRVAVRRAVEHLVEMRDACARTFQLLVRHRDVEPVRELRTSASASG